jgi:serine/threonine protein kinase
MAELDENSVIDGRYRIIGHVGSGGMADVYRAEDTHLGRTVALKLLYRRFAQDQEFVERFRREASAAADYSTPTSTASTTAANTTGPTTSRWNSARGTR